MWAKAMKTMMQVQREVSKDLNVALGDEERISPRGSGSCVARRSLHRKKLVARGLGGQGERVDRPRGLHLFRQHSVDRLVPLDRVHALEGLGDDLDAKVGTAPRGLRPVSRVTRRVVVNLKADGRRGEM